MTYAKSHRDFLPRSLDFVGLGQMKSGTTALWEYIMAHPDVYSEHYERLGVSQKESLFYTHTPLHLNYLKRFSTWRDNIMAAPDEQLVGEFSVHNMDHPDYLWHIKQHSPNAKLIAILRNPADRVYSQWNWLYNQNGVMTENIRAQAATDIENLVRKSRYGYQVEMCTKFFPSKQMLFIKYEDFLADNQATVEKVLEFLNLDLSAYSYKPIKAQEKPYAESLPEYLKDNMLNHLYTDVCKLEELLGWDCTDWKAR